MDAKKYRCIKPFTVDNYDENGCWEENNSTVVETGSLFTLDDSGITIIGGEVHLDEVDSYRWLEITRERLNEYFEEVGQR